MKATLHFDADAVVESTISTVIDGSVPGLPGTTPPPVDRACNTTITLSCLEQLYNFVGYKPKVPTKNTIGISSYLGQFANLQDLKSFYLEQRPEAANSTFEFISVKGKCRASLVRLISLIIGRIGGLNNQTLGDAGIEANLDTQFAFGLSYPTRSVVWSTPGSPPFNADLDTPDNING